MDRSTEAASKLDDVLWRTVSQRVFGFGPHKLIGVKFWGIGWKSMHMEPVVLANELLDDDAHLKQMAQEVTQESDDLHPGNIGSVETEVKSKPLARRGDGDGRDSRNSLPAVAVSEDWGVANRRPSLAHVSD